MKSLEICDKIYDIIVNADGSNGAKQKCLHGFPKATKGIHSIMKLRVSEFSRVRNDAADAHGEENSKVGGSAAGIGSQEYTETLNASCSIPCKAGTSFTTARSQRKFIIKQVDTDSIVLEMRCPDKARNRSFTLSLGARMIHKSRSTDCEVYYAFELIGE